MEGVIATTKSGSIYIIENTDTYPGYKFVSVTRFNNFRYMIEDPGMISEDQPLVMKFANVQMNGDFAGRQLTTSPIDSVKVVRNRALPYDYPYDDPNQTAELKDPYADPTYSGGMQ